MFEAIGLALAAAINLFCASLAFCASDTTKDTIIEEWNKVRVPPAPELKAITVDAEVTALLILDIQYSNCNPETRARCVATLPGIQSLLAAARKNKVPVIYTLTRSASEADIRKELSPLPGEPIVKSGVDKFFMTDLAWIIHKKRARQP